MKDPNETRNAILSIKIAVNEQAERYYPNTSEFDPITEHIDNLLEQYPEKKQVSISGKVKRDKAEVIIIFKVGGKLYPQNEHNGELVDAYMHTGDEKYLEQLTDEIPF